MTIKDERALKREPSTIDFEPNPVLVRVRFYAEATGVKAWACLWMIKGGE